MKKETVKKSLYPVAHSNRVAQSVRAGKRSVRAMKLMAAVAAATMVGSSGSVWAMGDSPDITEVDVPVQLVAPVQAATTNRSSNGLADLIETVKPAVVNVSVKGHHSVDLGPGGFPQGTPFDELFRRHFGAPPPGAQTPRGRVPQRQAPQQEFRSVGSGFIISPDGYVVTNYHVIKDADEVTIITDDGKRYPATVKGHDIKTDLALLKIKPAKSLHYVHFGNSDRARVGDRIVAIGNPFGLGGSATTGIISARGRDINSGPFDDFIQIDAPINQGNSGGPLFDMRGQVIGINTAIYSPHGGNVGIGFAIPAEQAKLVIDQLKGSGHVSRGWLGVQIQSMTPELAQSMSLPDEKGALVSHVVVDSPAAEAGIHVGDLIVAFNGKKVARVKDLTSLVAHSGSDQKATVEVLRDGKRKNLKVKLARSPDSESVAQSQSSQSSSKGKMGLVMAPLDERSRMQFGVDRMVRHGALIVDVRQGSPADKTGLRPGDVIMRVGNRPVKGPEDVVTASQQAIKAKRGQILLLINRQGSNHFVAVDLI